MSPPDAEAVPEATRAARRIRIVDADAGFVLAFTQALLQQGYDCRRVEEGAEVASDVLIEVRSADPLVQVGAGPAAAPSLDAGEPARLVRLDDVIRRHVLEVFHATNDNVTRTALALGISRVALRRRLRAYGAKPQPFAVGATGDPTR